MKKSSLQLYTLLALAPSVLVLLLLVSGLFAPVSAPGGSSGISTAAAPTYTEGSPAGLSFDLAGNVRVTKGTLDAGEDLTATGAFAGGVVVTEDRYLTIAPTLVDVQVKASAGYVKRIVCAGSDATATAGTIILYDSLTETGTVVYQWDVLAVAISTIQVIPIERAFTTGIYLGFTTTGDVRCIVAYR